MSVETAINLLIERAHAAQQIIECYTQEQVDELIRAMVWSVARAGVAVGAAISLPGGASL
jgi:sulfoacetaldehyde dehydrogenase